MKSIQLLQNSFLNIKPLLGTRPVRGLLKMFFPKRIVTMQSGIKDS